MLLLILGSYVDDRAVVKLHRKGEYPNAGDASEDSDYQDSSERVGGLEAQNDRKEKVDRELLPVLTVGSFTRYVQ